jgi:Arf/Sar family protein
LVLGEQLLIKFMSILLLQNFGLTNPLPTVALAVTGLMGVLAAVFIFQSASKN